MWWCMLVIPALRRQRKASLGYIVRFSKNKQTKPRTIKSMVGSPKFFRDVLLYVCFLQL
jgi:hypothetical protein